MRGVSTVGLFGTLTVALSGCFADSSPVGASGDNGSGTSATGSGDAVTVSDVTGKVESTGGTGSGSGSADATTTVAFDSSGGSLGGTQTGTSGDTSPGDTETGEDTATTGGPLQPDCCEYAAPAECNLQTPLCVYVASGKDQFCDSACAGLDQADCLSTPFCFSVNARTCVPGAGSAKACDGGAG